MHFFCLRLEDSISVVVLSPGNTPLSGVVAIIVVVLVIYVFFHRVVVVVVSCCWHAATAAPLLALLLWFGFVGCAIGWPRNVHMVWVLGWSSGWSVVPLSLPT